MGRKRAADGRVRRFALTALATVAITALVVAVRVVPSLLRPNEYAHVRTIQAEQTYQDPTLMQAALDKPVALQFRLLPFEYQRNQSFCGPASIANVLHSLGDATSQDGVLAGSPERPVFGYLLRGLTLDQFGDLPSARTDRPVVLRRGLSLSELRALMRLSNDPRHRIVANFHRGPLFARGHGHFSPLLAYLEDQDLVLVGDVNPDYRPFLVETKRFWRAVNTIDPVTGKLRGLAIVTLRR